MIEKDILFFIDTPNRRINIINLEDSENVNVSLYGDETLLTKNENFPLLKRDWGWISTGKRFENFENIKIRIDRVCGISSEDDLYGEETHIIDYMEKSWDMIPYRGEEKNEPDIQYIRHIPPEEPQLIWDGGDGAQGVPIDDVGQ